MATWTLKRINCGTGEEEIIHQVTGFTGDFYRGIAINLLENNVRSKDSINLQINTVDTILNDTATDPLSASDHILGTFSTSASSTKWRLNFTSGTGQNGLLAAFELQVHDSGGDITSDITVLTPSSADLSNDETNMTDGNTTTFWLTEGLIPFPHYLEFEFATAKALTQYDLYWNPATEGATDWTLDYWNGSSWVPVDTRISQTEDVRQWYNYSVQSATTTEESAITLHDLLTTTQVVPTYTNGAYEYFLVDSVEDAESPLGYVYATDILSNYVNALSFQAAAIPDELDISIGDHIHTDIETAYAHIPLITSLTLEDFNTLITSTFVTDSAAVLEDTINALAVMADLEPRWVLADNLTALSYFYQDSIIYNLVDYMEGLSDIHFDYLLLPLTDTLRVIDVITFGYLKTLTDNSLVATDSSTLIYQLVDYVLVLNQIFRHLGYTLDDSLEAIAEIFNVLEEELLNDTSLKIEARQSLSLLIELVNSILANNSVLLVYSLEDDLDIDEEITALSIYNLLLNDSINTTVILRDPNDTVSYVLNPRLRGMTTYSNWDFNSYIEFDNQVYASNSTGLYRLTGSKDVNDYIVSSVKTGMLDFGTSEFKSMEQAYIGIDSGGNLILTYQDDEDTRAVYTIASTVHTNRIKLAKGLISRYFEFKLEDIDSEEFDLDSLELQPIPFTRRLR